MEKNNMKLTPDEYMDIAYKDSQTFKLIEDKIVDTSRWAVQHEVICQHIESGKFYYFWYDQPATEMQEVDQEDQTLKEVRPVEKTIIVYEEVK